MKDSSSDNVNQSDSLVYVQSSMPKPPSLVDEDVKRSNALPVVIQKREKELVRGLISGREHVMNTRHKIAYESAEKY